MQRAALIETQGRQAKAYVALHGRCAPIIGGVTRFELATAVTNRPSAPFIRNPLPRKSPRAEAKALYRIMKKIYRCKHWEATDRVEVENGTARFFRINTPTIPELCIQDSSYYERMASIGEFTVEEIPAPAEPDYTSDHYRAYVEAAFAGGLRVQTALAIGWKDVDSVSGAEREYRIHPLDANKEPDYSSKSYQRRVLLAAFDGVPCQYTSHVPGQEWSDYTNIDCIFGMLKDSDWKIRIAPPIKPQPAPPRMVALDNSDYKVGDLIWVGEYAYEITGRREHTETPIISQALPDGWDAYWSADHIHKNGKIRRDGKWVKPEKEAK